MAVAVTVDNFRKEIRAWLNANLPPTMATLMPPDEIPWGGNRAVFPNAEARLWLDRCAAAGYTAPAWPVAYGGAGLSATDAAVLAQEMAAAKARPPLMSFGVWMLGPVLLEYGTEEQRVHSLPAIARGEIRWCQGYSEPEAGSDLASLRTLAVDEGDHWLLNGQKIWTTDADQADWIFCLVRTNMSVPKHKGISFILVDLASAGLTVRPIRLISGSSRFCETFFDDVRVPKENLVGAIDGGWAIAKKLLEYERQNVSAAGFGGDRTVTLASLAKRASGTDVAGRIADPVLRERIARQAMTERAIAAMTARAQSGSEERLAGAFSSIIKYASAKANQDRHELAIEILGLDAAGWSGDGFVQEDLDETRKWLRSKGNSIEGGTSEINLNVLAKRVLGLPEHGG
jgi:alkylation response protein AidB-like acyl-CoA dehydrogenase